jgi:hypothetical protein
MNIGRTGQEGRNSNSWVRVNKNPGRDCIPSKKEGRTVEEWKERKSSILSKQEGKGDRKRRFGSKIEKNEDRRRKGKQE